MMLWGKIDQYVFIFLVGEVFSIILFFFVTKYFQKKLTISALGRGWLERSFLYIALIKELPQALILFGALKIGTRLKDGENRISNDYFLTGNLISSLLAIIYYIISTEVFDT